MWLDLAAIVSTLLGVFLGFELNRQRERWRDNKSRKRAIFLILSELKKCADTGAGLLMPTDAWEAVASSGKQMLLEDKILISNDVGLFDLAGVYYRIRMNNYEAEKLRRFRDERDLALHTVEYDRLHRVWAVESGLYSATYESTCQGIRLAIERLDRALEDYRNAKFRVIRSFYDEKAFG